MWSNDQSKSEKKWSKSICFRLSFLRQLNNALLSRINPLSEQASY
jgi:hypothetical protein